LSAQSSHRAQPTFWAVARGDADLAPASMLALPACDGLPTSTPMANAAPSLKM